VTVWDAHTRQPCKTFPDDTEGAEGGAEGEGEGKKEMKEMKRAFSTGMLFKLGKAASQVK
jgi:hypothetical protein